MKVTKNPDARILGTLTTPKKIQDYLDSIPFNHEKNGETCRSAALVIEHKTAHCLEGAFLACAALLKQGRKPLIISLKVTDNDYDHVIAVYKEGAYFGAISKTNHAVLSFRDPVYRSVRELVMSYFHEYFLVSNGEKTLRGYSRLINLNRFGTLWKDSSENLLPVAYTIAESYHIPIIPKGHAKFIRKATKLERKTALITWDD